MPSPQSSKKEKQMAWINSAVTEGFISNLKEARGQEMPVWEDPTRGILVALIQERQTIWNADAQFIKDDLLASFQLVSSVLSKMDPRFTIWAVIEKWCWMVEIYIRCGSVDPSINWRYNNSLDFISKYKNSNYPYYGSLTPNRLIELTKQFETYEIMEVVVKTGRAKRGLFREELSYFCGETDDFILHQNTSLRTVLMVPGRKRGRPRQKFEPVAQTSSSQSPASIEVDDVLIHNDFDEFGFCTAMYTTLIDLAEKHAELWHTRHPQYNSNKTHLEAYEKIANQIKDALKDKVSGDNLNAVTIEAVMEAWGRIKKRFYEDERNEHATKSPFYESLLFLSYRIMPAYLYDSVYLNKPNDPTSSNAQTAAQSPGRSESSTPSTKNILATNMASPSPMVLQHPKIQKLLDHFAAAQQQQSQLQQQQSLSILLNTLSSASTSGEENEIGFLAEIQKLIKPESPVDVEGDGSPNAKKMRSDSPQTMVVVNDTRKMIPTTISTWVPPKEDLTTSTASTVKKDDPPPSMKKNPSVATAVIKTNTNPAMDKQLKKMQQTIAARLSAAPSAVLHQQSPGIGLMNINSMAPISIQNPTISQALFKPKMMDNNHMLLNMHHAHNQEIAPAPPAPIKPEMEDKWSLLGRLVTAASREIEANDAVSACHLFKEVQELLFKYQMRALSKADKK